MIRTIEEYSLNAWPALQTVLYDGWVLRFANGYTRRANSANPLYASTVDVNEKIGAVEALYASLGLPACFKLTGESQPGCLDEALAARGYAVDAPTSVQTADIRGGTLPETDFMGVEMTGSATGEWQAGFAQASKITPERQATHEQILGSILLPCGYALVREAEQAVCFGLAVAQDGWVGLFDIVTNPLERRKGHARRLVGALLDWGRRQGARAAYLQVMQNNAPALNLYAGLGFAEAYSYWYRVKR